MTPSRRCTVALTVASLLLTVPALAAPAADAQASPVLDRATAFWSQLWTAIDRFLPGTELSSPTLERATGGSGALLNPDGFAPAPPDGDQSGALLNPDG